MADRLERFINLIAKTGDKLLVYDRHNPDDSFVVVSLESYEQLMQEANGVKGLTEDELIDKINRDIALWKSEQDNGRNEAEIVPAPSEFFEGPRPEKKPRSNFWSIPQSRRRANDQVNN